MLAAQYPPEQRHGLALDAIFAPNIRFFLAYLNGLAVGCGGVAFVLSFARVKRRLVREVAHGRRGAHGRVSRIENAVPLAGLCLRRLLTAERHMPPPPRYH